MRATSSSIEWTSRFGAIPFSSSLIGPILGSDGSGDVPNDDALNRLIAEAIPVLKVYLCTHPHPESLPIPLLQLQAILGPNWTAPPQHISTRCARLGIDPIIFEITMACLQRSGQQSFLLHPDGSYKRFSILQRSTPNLQLPTPSDRNSTRHKSWRSSDTKIGRIWMKWRPEILALIVKELRAAGLGYDITNCVNPSDCIIDPPSPENLGQSSAPIAVNGSVWMPLQPDLVRVLNGSNGRIERCASSHITSSLRWHPILVKNLHCARRDCNSRRKSSCTTGLMNICHRRWPPQD